MFSLFSLKTGSFRKLRNVSTLAVLVLVCIFAVLIIGCKIDDSDFIDDHQLKSSLIGIWNHVEGDGYTITETTLAYNGYDDAGSFSGTIKHVSNFSKDAGVIIIEYDELNKPVYFINEHWEDPDKNHYLTCTDPSHISPLKGDFVGIYFRKVKSGISAEICTAYIQGGTETETLDEAKIKFTSGFASKHTGDNWPAYAFSN